MKDWSDNTLNRGSIPLIIWQAYNPCRGDPCCDPADASCGSGPRDCSVENCTYGLVKETDKGFFEYEKKFSLKRIAAGDFDSYLRTWARQIKDWGKPVMLRPMHEMNTVAVLSNNCSKPPWYLPDYHQNTATMLYDSDCTTLASTPQDAVNAWRHIVDVFREEGATNVTWLWTLLSWPSASYGGNNPTTMASIYPGDSYVDWIGIECYNTFDPNSTGVWPDCREIMNASYREATALSATKPLMIAEMGSFEKPGNSTYKPEWIRNALSLDRESSIARNFPRIKAVFWWNDGRAQPDTPWIHSSNASIASFRDSIAGSVYDSNLYKHLKSVSVPEPEKITEQMYTTYCSSFWNNIASLGGYVKYEPSIEASAGRLIVTGIGSDNALWANEYIPGQTVSPWYSLQGVLSSRTKEVIEGSKLKVYGLGSDRYVWNRNYSSGAWTSWASTGLTGLGTTGPQLALLSGRIYRVSAAGDGMSYIEICGTTTTTTSSTSTTTSTTTTTSSSTTSVSTTTSTSSSSTTTSPSTTTTSTTLPQCVMQGNDPPCGEVTLSEVMDAINQWAGDNLDLASVIDLINSWSDPLTYLPC
jgi:hypothetical protein